MATSPTLKIHLLGRFQLAVDDKPVVSLSQPRMQFLLAYLLLHRDKPISRQQLAFVFWPDTTEEQAHANLRNLLHRLRTALPGSKRLIRFDRHQVWWQDDGMLWLDVAAFAAALAEAAAAEGAGNSPAACRALEAALACYEGELLPTCYDDWIAAERERLHQAHLRGLNHLVALLQGQRSYDEAIRYAQRLAQHDPLHEPATQLLMRLHLAAGSRTDALRVYHAAATLLRRELGVDPSPETQALYLQVLRADEAPVATVSPLPPVPVLVGRQAEWAQLHSIWRRAAAGHPHMALLVGETGIGKTRLAEELIEWARVRQQTTALARCTPTESTLSYAPVAALLRVPVLCEQLVRLDAAWLTEISRLLPEIATAHRDLPPPGPITEAWQRQRLFQALAQALLAPDPPAPLLLCMDDLQWADSDTLDWLLYLLTTAGSAPLLVVATACCSEFGDESPVEALCLKLQRHELLTRIELSPLPLAAVAELAQETAGRALSPAEAGRLYRETEGNPLFVVEMARAGLELEASAAGMQPLPTHGASIEGDFDPVLPPKVEAAIRRRLAGLSAPARNLAQIAAVLGRTFTVELLARVSALAEDALLQGLDELWRQRIMREQAAAAYDFTHDKLRAVAYAELSPARRRHLHRRAAEALEAPVPAAEAESHRAAQLARHYLEAGDERKALGYFLQAGDQARVLYAHREAITCYQHAAALQRRLEFPQAAARTLMKLGLAHHDAFDFAQARQAYEAAFELWQHAPVLRLRAALAAPQTLRSHWGSLTTLDPGLVADFNTVAIVEELFTGLADHGPDAEVTPALAAGWDVTDGGRRYVFRLCAGLRWSDGVALTAADFEAGWRRVLHPATGASCAPFLYDVRGARAYHRGETDDPAVIGVSAPEEHTLVVELEQPTGYFPHLLANPVTYPIPRHALAAHGPAWAEPEHLVCNGPFVLAEWQRGARLS